MHSITTYHDALQAIWDRSGYDRGFISNPFAGDDAARLGLQRTQRLIQETGYSQLPYGIVHVAGSKGKGSTCIMIDAMLRAANLRTGRYISPHLHSFRERFVVNAMLISEHDFIRLTRQFVTAAADIEQRDASLGRVTAFELTTAMALAWFAQQGCDVAVIEVGLGGTLDATNIVDPLVSVITTLDYEHTAILGSTMAEIAANKAGIIKPGHPVVVARQPAEGMEVIIQRASGCEAPISIAERDWHVDGDNTNFAFRSEGHELRGLKCPLVGAHQVQNAGLAVAAVLALQGEDPDLRVSETAVRSGLASATLPARFEQVKCGTGHTVIIDGAHTPASTAALAAAVKQAFPEANVTLVIGVLADKNIAALLEPLQGLADHWIAVSPDNPRAMPAAALRELITTAGHDAAESSSVAAGIEQACRTATDLIVVTGSFATAAEARVELGLAPVVDPPMNA